MTNELLPWVLLALLVLNLALLVWLLLRQQQLQQQGQRVERVESELRREISESSRGGRQEIQQTLATFQETLTGQSAETTRTQNAQLDAFAQQLVLLRGTLGDTLTRQLQDMGEGNARRLAEIRTTLDAQLQQLQQSNAAKLDEMRATVDEKLQTTLQARLAHVLCVDT
eukprot:Opistho-1_new@55197